MEINKKPSVSLAVPHSSSPLILTNKGRKGLVTHISNALFHGSLFLRPENTNELYDNDDKENMMFFPEPVFEPK